ncbi:MAG: hypothetical protein IPH75_04625 [bacterium]|nr:hypothetical protein [bacterium]
MQRLRENAAAIIGPFRTLWLSLYSLKLLFGLAITLPILLIIQSKLDNSISAEVLLGDWSIDVILELILTNDNIFSLSLLFMLAIGVVAFLLKQFLNGGIYDSLVNRHAPVRDRFFAQSAAMFLQHLTIGLWMFGIYFLLFLAGMFFGELATKLAHSLWPNAELVHTIAKIVVLYLVMIVGGVFSEFVRIHRTLVLQQGRAEGPAPSVGIGGLGLSFKAAYQLVTRRGPKALATYLVYFLPFVFVWLLIEGLALLVTGGIGNIFGAIIEFALFQACAMAKVWQSLAGSLAMTDFVEPPVAENRLEESSDRTPVLS